MTKRRRVIDGLSLAFQRFVALESASTILLLGATITALALANSAGHGAYEHALHLPVSLGVGSVRIEMTLHHFVNDVLMAIFFFVVGMEIKRELVKGELSSRARAALPFFGAIGGMVAPAAIYAALHAGTPTLRGWGVPMATDIAFAIAALGVFGSRVPPALKVFLLALAIIDDLGAVLVIALFYSDSIAVPWIVAAAAGLAACGVLGRLGVRAYGVYVGIGALVWFAVYESGLHATIAGVALGLITPARPVGGAEHSPIDDLEHRLHGWVAFAIMPIFALANAGVALDASSLGDADAQRVALGVALGLLVGKPVGITALAWLAVRLRIAELPSGVGWSQIGGVGMLAGIGFTMALFIASLAFEEAPNQIAGAKIGILGASTVATAIGVSWLSRVLAPTGSRRD